MGVLANGGNRNQNADVALNLPVKDAYSYKRFSQIKAP
jgi:hypothetical protein